MSKQNFESEIAKLRGQLATIEVAEMPALIEQINRLIGHSHEADAGESLLELSKQLQQLGEKKIKNDYSNLQKELAGKEVELQEIISKSSDYARIAGTALIELQALEKDYEQKKQELERRRYGAQTQENYNNKAIQDKQREIQDFKRVHNL